VHEEKEKSATEGAQTETRNTTKQKTTNKSI